MCFIVGYVTKKPADLLMRAVVKILLDSGATNKDATGLAWFEEDVVHGVKGGFEAKEFVDAVHDNLPVDRRIVIGHVRTSTGGSPRNNANNHPVINKDVYLIHNGSVYGGLPAADVVDTMKLAVACNAKPDLIESICDIGNSLSGWYACAVLSNRLPGKLLLFRHNAKMEITYVPTLETVFFSTDSRFVVSAISSARPILGGLFHKYSTPICHTATLPAGKLLVLDQDLDWQFYEMNAPAVEMSEFAKGANLWQ